MTGEPITIGMMSPVDSPTLSLPEYPKAAQAAADSVNASGGINGRPLKFVHCDDKDDPATASVCARTLLQDDDAIAMVGSVSRQSAVTYPVLDATNKVSFGVVLSVPDDYNNPASYPLMGGSAPGFNIPALIAKDPSVKTVVIAATAASTGQVVIDNMSAGLTKAGITPVPIRIDPKQVDMTPYALQIRDSGAQAVIVSIAPQSAAPLAAQAARLKDVKFYISGWLIDSAGAAAFQQAGVEPVIAMNADLGPQNARFQQYKNDIAKYTTGLKNADYEIDFNAWLSVNQLAEILRKLPDPTPAALKDYLTKNPTMDTGVTHPLDFASTPAPSLPRWKNVWIKEGKLDGGKVVATGGDWVSSYGG
ncbi:MAG: hypothetical protein ABS81_05375 [Pseudonocardia sp. SCN 72-86]|nr:MAG: hypothetical protein ABS81_05375 [Pseudonocardia sp. SCN 72-86]